LLALTIVVLCADLLLHVSVFNVFFIVFCVSIFYCPVYRRDLHSFPTRRSSDLIVFSFRSRVYCMSQRMASAVRRSGRTSTGTCRSEEHTSELQSRGHLVCRLLLEKKNHRRNRAWLHGHYLGPPRCPRF